jgi:8-oxo-dGTP diphosphatase
VTGPRYEFVPLARADAEGRAVYADAVELFPHDGAFARAWDALRRRGAALSFDPARLAELYAYELLERANDFVRAHAPEFVAAAVLRAPFSPLSFARAVSADPAAIEGLVALLPAASVAATVLPTSAADAAAQEAAAEEEASALFAGFLPRGVASRAVRPPERPAQVVATAGGAWSDRSGVLLEVRSPQAALDPAALDTPGGKLEPGESPEAALSREFAEELGLKIEASDLRPLYVAAEGSAPDAPTRWRYEFEVRRAAGSPTAREHGTFVRLSIDAALADPRLQPGARRALRRLAASSRPPTPPRA